MPDAWLINGIPGSGKTTNARVLASYFGWEAHIEGEYNAPLSKLTISYQ